MRAHEARPEQRRQQLPAHRNRRIVDRVRDEGRVRVVDVVAIRSCECEPFEVDLVAAIDLEPVDPGAQQPLDPLLEGRGDRRVGQVERLEVARPDAADWVDVPAADGLDHRRDPHHDADAPRMEAVDHGRWIGEPPPVERHRADARRRLPGVVDDHPAERDPGSRELVGVLGELGGRRRPRRATW